MKHEIYFNDEFIYGEITVWSTEGGEGGPYGDTSAYTPEYAVVEDFRLWDSNGEPIDVNSLDDREWRTVATLLEEAEDKYRGLY